MSQILSACSKCHALNNVNTSNVLSKKPMCGKCGADLEFYGRVSQVSGEDMMRIIRKSDKPVVVDFWASWCGPCQMYGPEFEKASRESESYVFLKVNTEADPGISQQLGIRGIPATVVFKDGKELKRQAGAMSSDQLLGWLG